MELACASRYAKIQEADFGKAVENHKNSLASYERARAFVDEYKKKK